uniref:ADAM metallopeptidase domain 8a n=1 Tax=Seriola lalandi dorsalis TaxID=1841481 RepID=A0A3B4YCJ2_SERLL
QYSLTIAGQNYTLHLERNKDLIGKNFSVTHYSDQGTQITTTPDLGVHCYYHGHIVGVEDSSASVGLCSGIKGFVRLQGQIYLIEPLSSEAHSGEGLHAVYNYQHLRRKRSSCSHGNTTTFYDHGARPSGLFQLSSLVKTHRYKKFDGKKTIETRLLEIANHVDKLYRPLGVRVMLVALDIWSYRDQIEVSTNPELTLSRFLTWRQRSLLLRTKHDNAQFITGVDFDGSTVGLANTNAMCTSNSGAVNEDHNTNPIGVASTIAHEMGHNLGLSHDTENCVCGSSISKKGCIMAESVGFVYPQQFSSCSQQQLNRFLQEVNPTCLLDTPSTDRIYGGPVCGNAFLEPGEECDCGSVEECKNLCCNATTCKLNTGAQCAEGECCHNSRHCLAVPSGCSVCRSRSGDCDLAEYCTGFSASCPTDAYTQNGLPCNRGKGYCYNGQCPSRQEHCKRLWGPGKAAVNYSLRCSKQSCGTLFCFGGWEFPVTSKKSFYRVGKGEICNEATMNPEDNYPADMGMVPTGTKCGHNMVCYNQRCQDIKSIKVYGTDDCSAKCNNHGVCNHESKCHCDPGWATPFCDVKQSELPGEANGVFIVSLALLCVYVYRCFRSTSGQSNPLFRSSSTRGSPRLGTTLISQPTFVESSATQACKPLFSATARPHTGAPTPSRAAPEAKPLPPSRPLPPLATKSVCAITSHFTHSFQIFAFIHVSVVAIATYLKYEHLLSKIMKPKPPMPPVKPKPSAVPSPLPHTQLVCIQTQVRVSQTFLNPWHPDILNVVQGIHVYKEVCGFGHCPNITV